MAKAIGYGCCCRESLNRYWDECGGGGEGNEKRKKNEH